MPTAVAIQWVDVTTPKVPSISGRVVNGLGFILDIRGEQRQDQSARRLFALGRSLAKRVYWKCHPRPRLFGIDRRVLAERADRSPPPNGGVTLRCTRNGVAPDGAVLFAERIPGRSLAQFPTPRNHAAIGWKIDRFCPGGALKRLGGVEGERSGTRLKKPPTAKRRPHRKAPDGSCEPGLHQQLDQRNRELRARQEQQAATSKVLEVISSSRGDLAPVFRLVLENAVRFCGAKFGNLWLREGDSFRIGAMHGTPPDEESLNLAYHGARAERQGFYITLQRSFDPAAGEADLFPQEITRVLLNLISNGFYAATKRKAQVGAGGYEPTLAASTKDLGDSVEIRIRDNGNGIPPEVREQMFNPFFTTKPAGEGTGLGLSISHDIIVKQHGGSIDVDTTPGEYTEFRIVLPRKAAILAKTEAPACNFLFSLSMTSRMLRCCFGSVFDAISGLAALLWNSRNLPRWRCKVSAMRAMLRSY